MGGFCAYPYTVCRRHSKGESALSPKGSPPHESTHHPGHRPYPPGPVHRFFALEKELSLETLAQALERFSTTLQSSGKIILREDLEVTPPDPCLAKIHFERTAKGHLIFKFELKWEAEEAGAIEGPHDGIESILNAHPRLGGAE